MMNTPRLFLCAGVLCMSAAIAQTVDPQNVLIRNVQLLDGGEGTEGVSVNILINDQKLIFCKQRFSNDGPNVAKSDNAGDRYEKVDKKHGEITHH